MKTQPQCQAHPSLYCRTHGEPLRRDDPRDLWACPERSVCGTYVTDEHDHRRRTRRTA